MWFRKMACGCTYLGAAKGDEFGEAVGVEGSGWAGKDFGPGGAKGGGEVAGHLQMDSSPNGKESNFED